MSASAPAPAVASVAPGAAAYELVEIAKSGHAICKKCHQLIGKGSLRVGKCCPDQDGNEQRAWYHPACWPVPRKLVSLDQVVGWEHLTTEQRAVLEARAAKTVAAQSSMSVTLSRQDATSNPHPTEEPAKNRPSTSRPKAGVDGVLADEQVEEAWLHGKAAAAGPSAHDGSGVDGPPADMTVEAWMARAPPGLHQSDLEFLLNQSVEECAEALPAMEARMSEARASADSTEEAAHLSFMVEVVRARTAAAPASTPAAADARVPAKLAPARAAHLDRGGPAHDGRPICVYGASCYRKNPQHRRDFRHDVDPEKKAAARGGGKRKRRGGNSEDSDADFTESEGEDEAPELMPSKLRTRRKRVDYAGMDGSLEDASEVDTEEEVEEPPRQVQGRPPGTRAAPVEDDSATEEDEPADRAGRHGGVAPASPAEARAEWLVHLGGSFQPFDPDVSQVIEEAYARRQLIDEVEVRVRNTEYLVAFSTMRQQLKSNPSRWRQVQRRLV